VVRRKAGFDSRADLCVLSDPRFHVQFEISDLRFQKAGCSSNGAGHLVCTQEIGVRILGGPLSEALSTQLSAMSRKGKLTADRRPLIAFLGRQPDRVCRAALLMRAPAMGMRVRIPRLPLGE
jgi:hypothetical protein